MKYDFVQMNTANKNTAAETIEEMVVKSRRAHLHTGTKTQCLCDIRLNDNWTLSVINNAHPFHEPLEEAAWLEISIVKNGKSVDDENGDMLFVDIRYNTFLYVLNNAKNVASLLFNLGYWESLGATQDLDLAYNQANCLLRLVDRA